MFEYHPLQADEIRLLTLHPPEEGAKADDPIRCTIEHTALPSFSHENSFDYRFKGDNHLWPEISLPCDTSKIFYTWPNPSTPSKSLPTSVPTPASASWQVDDEKSLPWRFSWGDYAALSYVWHPAEPRKSIILNDEPFTVGTGLYNALSHLQYHRRLRQGFKLWVDAVCINQDDMSERIQQVGRMRDIYASAWQVVMWLGNQDDESDNAIAALRWMAFWSKFASEPLEGFYRKPFVVGWLGNFNVTFDSVLNKKTHKAIFKLLTRPYFRRMWILQEIAMARPESPVVCGQSCISWQELRDAAAFIESTGGRFDRELRAAIGVKVDSNVDFDFLRGRMLEDTEWSSERTWKLILHQTSLQQFQKTKKPSILPSELLLPLGLSILANVTDDKDRVYGILGIKAIADRVNIIPDYQLDLATIYEMFTKQLVAGGDLTVFRLIGRFAGHVYEDWRDPSGISINGRPMLGQLVSSAKSRLEVGRKRQPVGQQCQHQLPSWAVCWSCKPPPTAQLKGIYHASSANDKSQQRRPQFLNDRVLRVEGLIFDTIASLSSFHPDETDDKYPFNDIDPSESIYGDLEATQSALWRTLVGNTTQNGGVDAPDSYSWLLDHQPWTIAVGEISGTKLFLSEFKIRNKKLILGGHSLEELIRPAPDRGQKSSGKLGVERGFDITADQRDSLTWAMNVMAWRRLVGTEEGRMGLVPASAQAGDRLAILMGSDVPVVLREHGRSWMLVGECYVHGVMKGELLSEDVKLSDIDII